MRFQGCPVAGSTVVSNAGSRLSLLRVARQLGHSAAVTLSTYAHVMEEFEDSPVIDYEAEVMKARSAAISQGLTGAAAGESQ